MDFKKNERRMEFLDKIKTFDTVVRMKATDKKGTQRGLAKMQGPNFAKLKMSFKPKS